MHTSPRICVFLSCLTLATPRFQEYFWRKVDSLFIYFCNERLYLRAKAVKMARLRNGTALGKCKSAMPSVTETVLWNTYTKMLQPDLFQYAYFQYFCAGTLIHQSAQKTQRQRCQPQWCPQKRFLFTPHIFCGKVIPMTICPHIYFDW
jgi:hypothetical protein